MFHTKTNLAETLLLLPVVNIYNPTKHDVLDVVQYLDKYTHQTHDFFRNTEWGSEKAEAMCNAVYSFELPLDKNGKVRNLEISLTGH